MTTLDYDKTCIRWMTKDDLLKTIIGKKWDDTMLDTYNWSGMWPVLDKDGLVHDVLDGNYPEWSVLYGLIVGLDIRYDEERDVYIYDTYR